MSKEQIICFQITIKSQKQIAEYKRREQNQIFNTPRLFLGKLIEDTQQVSIEEYKPQNLSDLRGFNSSTAAFDIALQIVSTAKQLRKVYGNFLLNENMVFVTNSKKILTWISSDIFANSPKIYLPQTKEGQISMIRGLVNYFKLWLKTQYSIISDAKTIQQLSFKLKQLKRQKKSKQNKSQKKIEESVSSNILLKKLSHQFYSIRNSKKQPSKFSNQESLTQRCFSIRPLDNKLNLELASKSQGSNFQTESHGQSCSFSNSFGKQVTKSFNCLKPTDSCEFKLKSKTTSSTLKIVQKIKQQDDSPQQYPSNKIIIRGGQKQQAEIEGELIGINQELDNLFLDDMESEDNEEAAKQRQKEFEELLNF